MLISDKSDPVLSRNDPGPKRSTIATIFFPFQSHIFQINVFCTDQRKEVVAFVKEVTDQTSSIGFRSLPISCLKSKLRLTYCYFSL